MEHLRSKLEKTGSDNVKRFLCVKEGDRLENSSGDSFAIKAVEIMDNNSETAVMINYLTWNVEKCITPDRAGLMRVSYESFCSLIRS
jgi:hypothetical protein